MSDADDLLRSAGAKVIASRPGLVLIEASDSVADDLSKSLVGWRVTAERVAAIRPPRPRVPKKVKE